MAKMRIAINGFGRIGRAAFKIALERPEMEVVAINDLADAKALAHLLQHDTAYGRYRHTATAEEGGIRVNDTLYPVLCEKDPTKLPWKDLSVDVVLECTGRFVDKYRPITDGCDKNPRGSLADPSVPSTNSRAVLAIDSASST